MNNYLDSDIHVMANLNRLILKKIEDFGYIHNNFIKNENSLKKFQISRQNL